jgi:ribosome-associated protein
VRDVDIRDEAIRLGQFLKLASIADSGSDARRLLDTGEVRVNGEPEGRRGRRLVPGDVVSVSGDTARVSMRNDGIG